MRLTTSSTGLMERLGPDSTVILRGLASHSLVATILNLDLEAGKVEGKALAGHNEIGLGSAIVSSCGVDWLGDAAISTCSPVTQGGHRIDGTDADNAVSQNYRLLGARLGSRGENSKNAETAAEMVMPGSAPARMALVRPGNAGAPVAVKVISLPAGQSAAGEDHEPMPARMPFSSSPALSFESELW